MITNKAVQKLLEKIKDKSYVNQELLNEFKEKSKNNIDFIGQNNILHHFGVFFVPYVKETQKVFFGHHIKADLWIPPGGHIEPNETPLMTVKRECREELEFEAQETSIEFINISITEIDNPRQICKTHYDLWHIVYTDKRDFQFDVGEFYEMKWISLTEAVVTLTKNRAHFKTVLQPLINS